MGDGGSLICTTNSHGTIDTEIDWSTYMQQVKGFLSGERDYALLGGDTGPLVYAFCFVEKGA